MKSLVKKNLHAIALACGPFSSKKIKQAMESMTHKTGFHITDMGEVGNGRTTILIARMIDSQIHFDSTVDQRSTSEFAEITKDIDAIERIFCSAVPSQHGDCTNYLIANIKKMGTTFEHSRKILFIRKYGNRENPITTLLRSIPHLLLKYEICPPQRL